MPAVIEAPVELVEAVADLHFPPRTDQRLQHLIDCNTKGTLRQEEREELESLVELSEIMSFVRSKALHLLGRRPL